MKAIKKTTKPGKKAISPGVQNARGRIFSVYLPQEIKDGIKAAAKENHRTISAEVETIFIAYLNHLKKIKDGKK